MPGHLPRETLRQLLAYAAGRCRLRTSLGRGSATVAEPVEQCARALSIPAAHVQHGRSRQHRTRTIGTFHHVFVHTRQVKKQHLSVTNGCLARTHNRNDSTATLPLRDPSATPTQWRPGVESPKPLHSSIR